MCRQCGREESGIGEEQFSCGGEVGEERDSYVSLEEWERSRPHKTLLGIHWIGFYFKHVGKVSVCVGVGFCF